MASENLLTAKQVRQRYGGISDMSLWRWLRAPELKFPKPLLINGRRYWRLVDLGRWEDQHSKSEAA